MTRSPPYPSVVWCFPRYTKDDSYILAHVAKHLVDLDEPALRAARARLGTSTIKDTVNEALRRTAGAREGSVTAALDALAAVPFEDRAEAWR